MQENLKNVLFVLQSFLWFKSWIFEKMLSFFSATFSGKNPQPRGLRGNLKQKFFWKASVLEKTEGNKDFLFIAKLKVFLKKPSVLCYKKTKQKEKRTEGNKGTRKFYEVRSERGDFNWCRFWASWVCTLMLW